MSISLVTGGSRGIGRSTALALAERGSDVIITYASNEGAAREVVAEIEKRGRRGWALPLDLAKTDTFGAFAERVKSILGSQKLDHLVNNAGVGGADFDTIFGVHVKGPMFLTEKLVPLLADGGRIVNLSSGLSRYAYPGVGIYSAAKAAVDAWTRALALELGSRRITANVVAPGGIETDFGGGVMRSPELHKHLIAETPLGRVGQPEDIAGIVALVCAPESGWMTGQRLEATGGYRL